MAGDASNYPTDVDGNFADIDTEDCTASMSSEMS